MFNCNKAIFIENSNKEFIIKNIKDNKIEAIIHSYNYIQFIECNNELAYEILEFCFNAYHFKRFSYDRIEKINKFVEQLDEFDNLSEIAQTTYCSINFNEAISTKRCKGIDYFNVFYNIICKKYGLNFDF